MSDLSDDSAAEDREWRDIVCDLADESPRGLTLAWFTLDWIKTFDVYECTEGAGRPRGRKLRIRAVDLSWEDLSDHVLDTLRGPGRDRNLDRERALLWFGWYGVVRGKLNHPATKWFCRFSRSQRQRHRRAKFRQRRYSRIFPEEPIAFGGPPSDGELPPLYDSGASESSSS